MTARSLSALVFVGTLCLAWCTGAPAGEGSLRMNQIQVIGTHNSYHISPAGATLNGILLIRPDAKDMKYEHAPLDVQLDRGVRSFEIDLHHFPDGYRVYHVPHIDENSSCKRLVDCLHTVLAWSEEHPKHVPISLLLEIKDEDLILAASGALPIDEGALDMLDDEIRAVIPPERLISPDVVRGDAATLEEAVLTKGWPTLDDARGKFLFILHEGGENREMYVKDRPSLEGRAMFIRSQPGNPYAATLVEDHPSVERIQERVRKGYYVRTRADAGLRQDKERRERAMASGAHILSTDFPAGEADTGTGYAVVFPDGAAARANPVNAPQDTPGVELEDPRYCQAGKPDAPVASE